MPLGVCCAASYTIYSLCTHARTHARTPGFFRSWRPTSMPSTPRPAWRRTRTQLRSCRPLTTAGLSCGGEWRTCAPLSPQLPPRPACRTASPPAPPPTHAARMCVHATPGHHAAPWAPPRQSATLHTHAPTLPNSPRPHRPHWIPACCRQLALQLVKESGYKTSHKALYTAMERTPGEPPSARMQAHCGRMGCGRPAEGMLLAHSVQITFALAGRAASC